MEKSKIELIKRSSSFMAVVVEHADTAISVAVCGKGHCFSTQAW